MLNPINYLRSSWSFTANFQTAENPRLALLHACKTGSLELLQKQIGSPVPIDKINEPIDGNLLLHTATKHGHLEIAKWLVKSGAKADCKDSHGMTAYDYAVLSPNSQEALWLLSAAVKYKVDWAMNSEVQKWAKEVQTDIRKACKEIDRKKINTQIHALHLLFGQKPLNMQKIRLLATEMLDNQGNTLVHFLAARGDQKRLAALLGQGIDPNIPNKQGQTPLHFAVAAESLCVQFLMEKGSDVEHKDKYDVSPLALIGLNAHEKDPLKVTKAEMAISVFYLAYLLVGKSFHTSNYFANLPILDSVIYGGLSLGQFKLLYDKFGLKFLLCLMAAVKAPKIYNDGFHNALIVLRCAVVGYEALKGIKTAWDNKALNPVKAISKGLVHGVLLAFDLNLLAPLSLEIAKKSANWLYERKVYLIRS
jgi:ankyrin repeat protein